MINTLTKLIIINIKIKHKQMSKLKLPFFTFFLLLFIINTNCFDVPEKLKNICPKGCKRYYNCDEKQKKCVFKGFFPIYPFELLELVILMISSALATSCGIGGGAVYTSMILGVEEMEPSEAMPISNFLILFCGLSTFVSFTLDKYKHPKNLFIHYDMAIIFGPSMLIGAKFGTILNKVLSSLLLLIFLLVVISYSTRKTYRNILKTKEKEAKLDQKNSLLEGQANSNLLGAIKEIKETKTENDIDNTKISSIISSEPEINDKQDRIEFSVLAQGALYQNENYGDLTRRITTEEDEKILREDDDPLNWERINFILLMEAIVIVDQLIEGSSKVPSFFGIKRCSFFYWLCFVIYVCITVYFIKIAVEKVSTHITRKKQLIPGYNSEVIENVERNINYVIFVGIIAGIVSSSIGIGGGMITNPVFSGLGMEPKQSSSTSNFLIIVTAIASCFIFITSGQLNLGYSICLGILCTIAAVIGSFFILKYINATGKSSVLLVIMEYFLVCSFFIALIKIFSYDTEGRGFIKTLFITNKFCE